MHTYILLWQINTSIPINTFSSVSSRQFQCCCFLQLILLKLYYIKLYHIILNYIVLHNSSNILITTLVFLSCICVKLIFNSPLFKLFFFFFTLSLFLDAQPRGVLTHQHVTDMECDRRRMKILESFSF